MSKNDWLGTNGDLYGSEINEPYLVPYLLSLGIEDYWVVQENAGYHYSGENRRVYPEYGVQILPLLSSSPDLHPIENVWAILKTRLQHRFTIPQNQPDNQDQLWAGMEAEWEEIDQLVLDKLADSMPNRVKAVISNN